MWLQHGLPTVRRGLMEPRVEAVDEEPVLLSSSSGDTDLRNVVRISGLGLEQADDLMAPRGAFYEVTLSGMGWTAEDGADDTPPVVFTARYLLTPWVNKSGRRGMAVETIVESTTVALRELVYREGASSLELELAAVSGEREVVVDVKRVGRFCTVSTVSLVV